VGDGPPSHHSVVDFPDFDAHDEMPGALANPFLEVLHQLACVLAEVYIYSLGFSLQDAVFVYKYEPHFCWRLLFIVSKRNS
jgi:hypothetical protein